MKSTKVCLGLWVLLAPVCIGYAQETPAPQTPPQQQEQPAAGIASPPKPVVTRERRATSDGAFSLSVFYWPLTSAPKMRTGQAAPENSSADTALGSKPKYAPGVVLSLPAGADHTLRFSYFQSGGRGEGTAAQDLAIFGTGFAKGDYLNSRYRLQNAKASLDFLTWPFPVNNAHFRIKTFWELQYTSVKWSINAPFKPTIDEDENYINTTAEGTNWFLYPSLGLGLEHMVTRHVRWELKGSGFAVPHRPALWDAEGLIAVRNGKWEFLVGAKAFHFKTSPKQEQFIGGTLSGGFAGIRWYP